ncbi:MAG: hypothetical protein OIN66_13895 [Candidatus Methanoperedens sp.]|nr:hypothetical protein [Candidatus Methanoperedens sp.]
MKTITIRVDEEIFQQIEAKRGETSKSEFYRNILVEYLSDKPAEDLNKTEYAVNTTDTVRAREENDALRSELTHKEDILRLMGERVKDMQSQLWFMQLEYQKLSSQIFKPLPAPRKWWMFWKK